MSRPVLCIALLLFAACGPEQPPPKAPAPPPPPPDPPVLASIAEACAKITSCANATGIRSQSAKLRDPSACVDGWLGTLDAKGADPLRQCLEKARGCADVQTCLRGSGDGKAAAFCAKAGVGSGCDGDRLVSCEDDAHESSVIDCAAMGATCRESKLASGVVLRACVSPTKCPAGAPEMRCDGPSAVISCREGGYERIECRPGTTCEERHEGGEAIASCELASRQRCDARGQRHCEEGRLVECERVGRTSRPRVSDCAGLGFSCTGTGPRAACVVPGNVECDREMLARCEGDALVFCAAGRTTRISCAALGLGGCAPAARGSIAACAGAPPPPVK